MSLAYMLAAGMLATVQPQPAPQTLASEAFNRLAANEGFWSGDRGGGKKPISVSIRKIAGGSAIVETWYPGTEREALTIYHMDGPTLVADHYCPQGNVPTLVMDSLSSADSYHFSLKGGANLLAAGASHEEEFWIRPISPNSYQRSERYVENGVPVPPAVGPMDSVSFRRIME